MNYEKSPQVIEEISTQFEAATAGDSSALQALEILLQTHDLAEMDDEGTLGLMSDYFYNLENAPFSEPLIRVIAENVSNVDNHLDVALVSCPQTPLDVLWTLATQDPNWEWEEGSAAEAVAEHASDAELLRHLAGHKHASVRFAVAANPSTPAEILHELADDSDFSDNRISWDAFDYFYEYLIKHAVVSNPSTAQETLQKFAAGEFNFDPHAYEEPEHRRGLFGAFRAKNVDPVLPPSYQLLSKGRVEEANVVLIRTALARLDGVC